MGDNFLDAVVDQRPEDAAFINRCLDYICNKSLGLIPGLMQDKIHSSVDEKISGYVKDEMASIEAKCRLEEDERKFIENQLQLYASSIINAEFLGNNNGQEQAKLVEYFINLLYLSIARAMELKRGGQEDYFDKIEDERNILLGAYENVIRRHRAHTDKVFKILKSETHPDMLLN